MRDSLLCLVMLFGLALKATAEEETASPFENMTHEVLRDEAFHHLGYGFVPGLSSWATIKIEHMPELMEFPKKLLKALDSPGTKDHNSAVTFVQHYAALARHNAYERGHRDLDAAAHRTFAPHAKSIKRALAIALDAPQPDVRCNAAIALLAFEPDHGKANSIVTERVGTADIETHERTCDMIGMLRLSNRDAVAALIQALGQKEPEVRRSAATAVWRIGPPAKAAIPALIDLFESGEAARGEAVPLFTIARAEDANLALLALSTMGPDAHRAVPVVLEKFRKVDSDEQRELLTFLARVGPAAKESVSTIEQAMARGSMSVRLRAACAMLCVVPSNNKAAALLKSAFQNKDKVVTARCN